MDKVIMRILESSFKSLIDEAIEKKKVSKQQVLLGLEILAQLFPRKRVKTLHKHGDIYEI